MNNSSIKYRLDLFKLILAFFVSVYIFFIGWKQFETTTIYYQLHQIYINFTFLIIRSFSDILGFEVSLLKPSNYVQYLNNSIELKLPFRTYYIFAIGTVFLFTVPIQKWIYVLNSIILVLLIIALRAAAKTVIELVYIQSIHRVLLIWIETSINITLFVFAYTLLKHNTLLNYFYQKTEKKFTEQLNLSFLSLTLLLIIIHPIPRILLTYLSESVFDGLIYFILSISKLLLQLFHQSTSISGQVIHLQSNWISLERTCLGIGVLTLLFTIIFATKTKLINKLIYFFAFTLFYFIVNSIRLSMLLYYLNKYYNSGISGLGKLHNDVSIILYIIAFLGFVLYIIWFGNINFIKKRR